DISQEEIKDYSEMGRELCGGEYCAASRDQLDRQRQAIEPSTDAHNRAGSTIGENRRRTDGIGAFDEQPDGIEPKQVAMRRKLWRRKGRNSRHSLAGDAQRLAACGQEFQVPAGTNRGP